MYKPAFDLEGRPVTGERARPVQTLIWYPARRDKNAEPMLYGQYVDLLATEEDLEGTSTQSMEELSRSNYDLSTSFLNDMKYSDFHFVSFSAMQHRDFSSYFIRFRPDEQFATYTAGEISESHDSGSRSGLPASGEPEGTLEALYRGVAEGVCNVSNPACATIVDRRQPASMCYQSRRRRSSTFRTSTRPWLLSMQRWSRTRRTRTRRWSG